MSDKEIDRLSPAEKYDLLLGDENFTFTHQVMKRIDDLDAAGQVAPWSGVCHGWSPASLTLARPGHKFYLTARNGRMIPFYPSDVKALASFLWGESFAQNSVKISGWQCSDPENQSENGRFLDPRCFDPNPAFFHLVTLNQIGLNRRGFVMDRSYHSEVQNQPVYGYEFKYFKFTDSHPIPEAKMTVQEAKVSRKDVSWDPYDDHRSPRAVSLLGVEAKIQYALENQPNHHPTDSVKEDNQDTLYLYYDLELDANNEIVGGEWHHFDDPTHHTDMDEMAFAKPDLLWLVPQGLKAWSIADADISSVPWDGMGTAPEAWTQAAIKAATGTIQKSVGGKDYTIANPQPLAYVVDLLIQMSRK
jgi:hypothetical protein